MKVVFPLAVLLLLTYTVLSLEANNSGTQSGTQPDCKFHGEVYQYGDTWPNNCAVCRCREAGTVICGPDVCSTCKWGSPTMYYQHKGFFVDGCKICECFDGIVSCSDQTELCEKQRQEEAERKAAEEEMNLENVGTDEISDEDLLL
ncbi:hypothetical protein ACHWQZ_G006045 [Mnemiopsis leidyi]